jgi:hypothetical protein
MVIFKKWAPTTSTGREESADSRAARYLTKYKYRRKI